MAETGKLCMDISSKARRVLTQLPLLPRNPTEALRQLHRKTECRGAIGIVEGVSLWRLRFDQYFVALAPATPLVLIQPVIEFSLAPALQFNIRNSKVQLKLGLTI